MAKLFVIGIIASCVGGIAMAQTPPIPMEEGPVSPPSPPPLECHVKIPRPQTRTERFREWVRDLYPFSHTVLFAGAAALTDRLLYTVVGPYGAAARFGLPLVAGIAAVELARGERPTKNRLLSIASYAATGIGLSIASEAFLAPLAIMGGPFGWFTYGAYTLVKYGAIGYLAPKVESWVLEKWGQTEHVDTSTLPIPCPEGVKAKLDSINP